MGVIPKPSSVAGRGLVDDLMSGEYGPLFQPWATEEERATKRGNLNFRVLSIEDEVRLPFARLRHVYQPAESGMIGSGVPCLCGKPYVDPIHLR